MCEMCNGKDLEQMLDELHLQVLVDGFAIVRVQHPVPWSYTIGLSAVGHPELVVAATEVESSRQLLFALGEVIYQDPVGAMRTTFEVGGEALVLRQVHASRLEAGLMAAWPTYAAAFDLGGRLEARQVMAPSSWFCKCHQSLVPHLDLPGGLPAPAPNRERRRRIKRHARRQ